MSGKASDAPTRSDITLAEDQHLLERVGAGRWPKYPEYKDSGINWLGKIPTHWQIVRLKFSTYVKGRVGWHGLNSNEFLYDGNFYLVTGTDFIDRTIKWDTCYRITQERFDEDPYIHLKEQDILVTKDGTIGKVAQVRNIPFKASVNSGVFVTRPLIGKCYDSNFMYYLLTSGAFNGFIDYQKTGTTINHLYQNVFENFSYCYPPDLSEQEALADFLDQETARIDELIAKKQRLIELLQEKRTALISQAVTKGLNPHAPMKDSGIDWLGKVPAHWEKRRLKFLLEEPLKYGANESAEFDDPNCPRYIRITDVDEEGKLRPDTFKSLPEEIAKPYLLKDGDLLMARSGATVGKTFSYKESWGNAAYAGYLIRARFRKSLLSPSFAAYFFFSQNYWNWLNSTSIQATIQNVSAEKYASLMFPIPGIKEQGMIISFLNQEKASIDRLIRKVLEAIGKLNEYRSSIISAAVTGKIDVRHLAKESVTA